jgi:hypothetical protein
MSRQSQSRMNHCTPGISAIGIDAEAAAHAVTATTKEPTTTGAAGVLMSPSRRERAAKDTSYGLDDEMGMRLWGRAADPEQELYSA